MTKKQELKNLSKKQAKNGSSTDLFIVQDSWYDVNIVTGREALMRIVQEAVDSGWDLSQVSIIHLQLAKPTKLDMELEDALAKATSAEEFFYLYTEVKQK